MYIHFYTLPYILQSISISRRQETQAGRPANNSRCDVRLIQFSGQVYWPL